MQHYRSMKGKGRVGGEGTKGFLYRQIDHGAGVSYHYKVGSDFRKEFGSPCGQRLCLNFFDFK